MNLDHALERVHQLEAMLGFRDFEIHGFTKSQSVILGLLLRKQTVTKEMLHDALYGDRAEWDVPDPKTIDVLVCHLRRALKPHGIQFKTWYGIGYYMDEANKAKLRAFAQEQRVVTA
jgi:DNA-binding response OmpR family regulator